MTEHQGLPVSGYRQQKQETIEVVNGFKVDEEVLLRKLDELRSVLNWDGTTSPPDQRWLAVARTHFEQGFMALNRAVLKPMRVKLAGEIDD